MRIAVYGTGGVGGYFGGKLAQAGEAVVFIARGAHLDAIRQNGLAVESVKGNFQVRPARGESDPAAVGPVDVVLVGVKSWQVEEAARAIQPMVDADTIVIPLQNGVEATGQLASALGAARVASGLCRISSMVAGPGHIRHVGIEPYIAFNWPDNAPDPRLETLRDTFLRQGVTAEIPADINAALWNKFTFIASIGGVGAVTRSPAGVMRALPETRSLLAAAIHEVAAVGRAGGANLAETLEQATLQLIDGLPPSTTASMQRDIIEGRPSELEAQNGAVVRLGKARGVETPTHDFIYASLLPQEKRARGELG